MAQPEAEEAQLVDRIRQGDTTAAHTVYRLHGASLLQFGLAATGSRHLAEDAVHDTFVEFLGNPGGFDATRGSLAAYLYGIARHRVARLMRQAAQGSGHSAGNDDLGGTGRSTEVMRGADEEADHERTITRVRRAVLDLPFAHREVVVLCDLQELPYAVVASILGCPIGTVRSRLHRARALLAERLKTVRDTAGRPDATGDQPPLLTTLAEPASDQALVLRLPCGSGSI
jgi:RNA polymerase sigma-70 factor (ECF subfamily)